MRFVFLGLWSLRGYLCICYGKAVSRSALYMRGIAGNLILHYGIGNLMTIRGDLLETAKRTRSAIFLGKRQRLSRILTVRKQVNNGGCSLLSNPYFLDRDSRGFRR